jgi:hypothetical protein
MNPSLIHHALPESEMSLLYGFDGFRVRSRKQLYVFSKLSDSSNFFKFSHGFYYYRFSKELSSWIQTCNPLDHRFAGNVESVISGTYMKSAPPHINLYSNGCGTAVSRRTNGKDFWMDVQWRVVKVANRNFSSQFLWRKNKNTSGSDEWIQISQYPRNTGRSAIDCSEMVRIWFSKKDLKTRPKNEDAWILEFWERSRSNRGHRLVHRVRISSRNIVRFPTFFTKFANRLDFSDSFKKMIHASDNF